MARTPRGGRRTPSSGGRGGRGRGGRPGGAPEDPCNNGLFTPQQLAAIHALQDANGRIDPEQLKEAARDPNHVLHDHPWWRGWNETEAAERYWTETAKKIIKIVKLEVRHGATIICAPYYVVDPNKTTKHTQYIALDRAQREIELAEQIMKNEIEQSLQRFARTERVAIALGLRHEIRGLIECLARFQAAFMQATAAPPGRRGRRTGRGRGPGKPRGRPPGPRKLRPAARQAGGTTGSMPFMITQSMKAQLRAQGHSDDDIKQMTPQQAHELLEGATTKRRTKK